MFNDEDGCFVRDGWRLCVSVLSVLLSFACAASHILRVMFMLIVVKRHTPKMRVYVFDCCACFVLSYFDAYVMRKLACVALKENEVEIVCGLVGIRCEFCDVLCTHEYW